MRLKRSALLVTSGMAWVRAGCWKRCSEIFPESKRWPPIRDTGEPSPERLEEWGREAHTSARQGKGFEVGPKRWVVERTFAWFNGQRRLSKDYGDLTRNS